MNIKDKPAATIASQGVKVEDKFGQVMTIQLGAYSIPDDIETPKSGATKWVDYGSDNDFDLYLEEIRDSSAVHGALCKGIARMAYGKGPVAKTTDLEVRSRIEAVVRQSARRSGRKSKMIKSSLLDLKTQGGYYWHVIMSKDGESVKELHHIPFTWVRPEKRNEQGVVEYYYVCRDWDKYRKKGYEPKQYPVWKPGVPSGILPVHLVDTYD
jgi:hypothetical protein